MAFEVLGGAAVDDLMNADQKRRMDEAKRKRERDMAAWSLSGAGRRGNLLSMVTAGGNKKFKKDRTNSPCHDCQ